MNDERLANITVQMWSKITPESIVESVLDDEGNTWYKAGDLLEYLGEHNQVIASSMANANVFSKFLTEIANGQLEVSGYEVVREKMYNNVARRTAMHYRLVKKAEEEVPEPSIPEPKILHPFEEPQPVQEVSRPASSVDGVVVSQGDDFYAIDPLAFYEQALVFIEGIDDPYTRYVNYTRLVEKVEAMIK